MSTRSAPFEGHYLAFDGSRLLIRGTLREVVLEVKRQSELLRATDPILVFDEDSGRQVDFNLRGSDEEVLRRLPETLSPTELGTRSVKQTQERTYRVMMVLAGNREGYEEALRALYRRDQAAFADRIQTWPEDIRRQLAELAAFVFQE